MIKQMVCLWVACAALLLQSAIADAADACTGLHAGANRVTLTSGGQPQEINLVLPAAFDATKRVPLVIGLHPSGGTGPTFDQDTGLGAAAVAKGFAVIFPDGG